jgi:hypothetical protein
MLYRRPQLCPEIKPPNFIDQFAFHACFRAYIYLWHLSFLSPELIEETEP